MLKIHKEEKFYTLKKSLSAVDGKLHRNPQLGKVHLIREFAMLSPQWAIYIRPLSPGSRIIAEEYTEESIIRARRGGHLQ